MRAIDAIRRTGISIQADQTVQRAAQFMEDLGVGALAVLDGEAVVGIVTDRDLVRRVLAKGYGHTGRVDAFMSMPPTTIEADHDVREAYGIFRQQALRRLPVVQDGRYVGMLTIDDLLVDLTGDLSDLVRPVIAEAVFGGHHEVSAPVPT